MSLLVRYRLKDAADHAAQVQAMSGLVAGLKQENIPGLNYSCFATGEPTEFVGILEFPDAGVKEQFLNSGAFARYRETVGAILDGPPETTEIRAVASTR